MRPSSPALCLPHIHTKGTMIAFALELEQMDEVKRFVKLPDWFTVDTPIGTYNPDWAILVVRQDAYGEEVERLYLVRETKGSTDEEQRRGLENLKIACARRHFAHLGVDYADVVRAEDLHNELPHWGRGH